MKAEVAKQQGKAGSVNKKWLLAGKLVAEMLTKEKLDNFLTSVAYPHIISSAFEGTEMNPDGSFSSKL